MSYFCLWMACKTLLFMCFGDGLLFMHSANGIYHFFPGNEVTAGECVIDDVERGITIHPLQVFSIGFWINAFFPQGFLYPDNDVWFHAGG